MTLVDHFIFLFGGAPETSNIRNNDLYRLDLTTLASDIPEASWDLIVSKSVIPPARGGHSAVTYGSKLIM